MIGQADCDLDDFAPISHAHDTSRSDRDGLDPLLLQYVLVLSHLLPVQDSILQNMPHIVTLKPAQVM
jgi:hypothetical protein